jgi:hypothetical protein
MRKGGSNKPIKLDDETYNDNEWERLCGGAAVQYNCDEY